MNDTALAAPEAPVAPPLPPDLAAFRSAPIPPASGLDSLSRMQRIGTYLRMKQDFKVQLTVEELRHIVELSAGARAETLRQKRADSAGAKKASASGPVKVPSIDDL